MPNKNYRSGRNFEYRVKKYLEKKGYYVMRSAGSKTPFDLIAVPTNSPELLCPILLIQCQILLIQCKHGAKISKQEKDKLQVLKTSFTGMAICAVAWSKTGGQIEFQYCDLMEWRKMENI